MARLPAHQALGGWAVAVESPLGQGSLAHRPERTHVTLLIGHGYGGKEITERREVTYPACTKGQPGRTECAEHSAQWADNHGAVACPRCYPNAA